MFNRSRALLAAVVLGAMSFSSPALSRQVTPTVVTVSKKQPRGLFNGVVHPSQPTWRCISPLRISVAQGKRNAAKRRNQRRHKRACRG